MKHQTHTHMHMHSLAIHEHLSPCFDPHGAVVLHSALSAQRPYLEQQVCGFEVVPAAARIKASVTEHEHGRLQDVATAPVVLETAIIKVHGKAQRLEIESHCKKQKKREVEKKTTTTGQRWNDAERKIDVNKKGRTLKDCWNRRAA